MGIGETRVGEMGVGETGPNRPNICFCYHFGSASKLLTTRNVIDLQLNSWKKSLEHLWHFSIILKN